MSNDYSLCVSELHIDLILWVCGITILNDHFADPFHFHDCEQVPGVTDLGLVPRQVKKVAVLGGGLMGSGIATALILSNYPVILKEVSDKFLQAGIGRVRGKDRNPCHFIII